MNPELSVIDTAASSSESFAETSRVRVDAQNPWPGAEAYDEAASDYFFGRDRESGELLRLIKLAPLTVVYGKSGLGKTSLLQAGLFPLLRKQHYLPVLKRLDFEHAGDAPLEQIKAALKQALDQAQIQYPTMDSGQSLWEYLHRADAQFVDADGEAVIPVLVLDQFEELFSRTRGSDKIVQQVFFDLADLIENRIPSELTGREARERRGHLDMLSQRYRVVLSFREDFIPMIRSWEKQVPSLLRNYLRLEPMSREQAIDAVNKAGAAVLEPGVAPAIVDLVCRGDQQKVASDTSDVVVEPVLLSLCCTQLNRQREGKLIDTRLVNEAGKAILESFYSAALKDPVVQGAPDAADFIETYLIQGDRFRGDYPRQEALDEGKLRPNQLAALTDTHRLLRIINRGDTPRIELIHDRLVPVVKKARDDRRLQAEKTQQEEKARKAEEERDAVRKRAAELERERNRARLARNLASLALAGALVAIIWGFMLMKSRRKEQKDKEVAQAAGELAVDTFRLAEGSKSLPGNSEPLDQLMYRALAAYRLSVNMQQMADAKDASLSAVELALDSSGLLAKVVKPASTPTDALAFSPDANTLAVGDEDGNVRLLDTHTYADAGTLSCQPPNQGEAAWYLAFNPAGTRLAVVYAKADEAATGQGLVCVFDMRTKTLWKKWSSVDHEQPGGGLLTIAYGGSPKGEFVVFGGGDKKLRKWNPDTGEIVEVQTDSMVVTAVVNVDSSRIVTGDSAGTIRVWSVAGLKPVMDFKAHQDMIQQVAFFAADPRVLLSVSEDGYLKAWNVAGPGPCLVAQQYQDARVDGVDSNEEGDVAVARADGLVHLLWLDPSVAKCSGNADKFGEVQEGMLRGHGGEVTAVVFSRKGTRLASIGQDGYVRFWEPNAQSFAEQRLHLKENTPEVMTSATASADGKFVAAGDDRGGLHLWRGASDQDHELVEEPLLDWSSHQGQVNAVLFTNTGDGLVLISAGEDGSVRLWDTRTGKPIGKEMKTGGGPVRAMGLSPDGHKLAAGSRDGGVGIWDVATGSLEKQIPPPKYGRDYDLSSVGFSEDGAYVATGSRFYFGMEVIDLKSPTQRNVLSGSNLGITRIGHAKGKWLVSADLDGSVLEWDKSALQQKDSWSFHKQDYFQYRSGIPQIRPSQPITAMDISADGNLFVTGGKSGQIQLWNGEKHAMISDRFSGHVHEIHSAYLSPNGEFFLTGSGSNILIWPGPSQWADKLCRKLTTNMSEQHWKAWILDPIRNKKLSTSVPYTDQCPGLPREK